MKSAVISDAFVSLTWTWNMETAVLGCKWRGMLHSSIIEHTAFVGGVSGTRRHGFNAEDTCRLEKCLTLLKLEISGY